MLTCGECPGCTGSCFSHTSPCMTYSDSVLNRFKVCGSTVFLWLHPLLWSRGPVSSGRKRFWYSPCDQMHVGVWTAAPSLKGRQIHSAICRDRAQGRPPLPPANLIALTLFSVPSLSDGNPFSRARSTSANTEVNSRLQEQEYCWSHIQGMEAEVREDRSPLSPQDLRGESIGSCMLASAGS